MKPTSKFLLSLVLIFSAILAFAAPGENVSQTAAAGKKVTIVVTADGTLPLAYQWQKAATATDAPADIPGATAAEIVLPNITASSAGVYSCKISNAYGAIVSPTATLTVGLPPTIGGTSISISVN